MRLRRVVILFDECEELFKTRDAHGAIGSRTSGAFITAGMLPRLQLIHNNQWIIFILATNLAPDKLDSAVTRPGRFDAKMPLYRPSLQQQLLMLNSDYIKKQTDGEVLKDVKETLCKLWDYQSAKDLDRILVAYRAEDPANTLQGHATRFSMTFTEINELITQVKRLSQEGRRKYLNRLLESHSGDK